MLLALGKVMVFGNGTWYLVIVEGKVMVLGTWYLVMVLGTWKSNGTWYLELQNKICQKMPKQAAFASK